MIFIGYDRSRLGTLHGLIGYCFTVSDSTPTGAREDWDFDSMSTDLNSHWGPEGEARCRAPNFVEVYDSETKEANHCEPMKGLFMRFNNSRFEFNTATACKVRFCKADGTILDAAAYPYIKGKTVVCLPPMAARPTAPHPQVCGPFLARWREIVLFFCQRFA